MLIIALKLCHIHVSPLVRRPTTTETSTHQLALTRCESELIERCGHRFFFQVPKKYSRLCSMSTQFRTEFFPVRLSRCSLCLCGSALRLCVKFFRLPELRAQAYFAWSAAWFLYRPQSANATLSS